MVLHSYVGSSEMVSALAKLGCYFSFSGHLTFHSHAKAKKTVNLVIVVIYFLIDLDKMSGMICFLFALFIRFLLTRFCWRQMHQMDCLSSTIR